MAGGGSFSSLGRIAGSAAVFGEDFTYPVRIIQQAVSDVSGFARTARANFGPPSCKVPRPPASAGIADGTNRIGYGAASENVSKTAESVTLM
jgi:hypothetical protein